MVVGVGCVREMPLFDGLWQSTPSSPAGLVYIFWNCQDAEYVASSIRGVRQKRQPASEHPSQPTTRRNVSLIWKKAVLSLSNQTVFGLQDFSAPMARKSSSETGGVGESMAWGLSGEFAGGVV